MLVVDRDHLVHRSEPQCRQFGQRFCLGGAIAFNFEKYPVTNGDPRERLETAREGKWTILIGQAGQRHGIQPSPEQLGRSPAVAWIAWQGTADQAQMRAHRFLDQFRRLHFHRHRELRRRHPACELFLTSAAASGGIDGAFSSRVTVRCGRSRPTGPMRPALGSTYQGAGRRTPIRPSSSARTACCDASDLVIQAICPCRSGPSDSAGPSALPHRARPVARIRRSVSAGSSSACGPE